MTRFAAIQTNRPNNTEFERANNSTPVSVPNQPACWAFKRSQPTVTGIRMAPGNRNCAGLAAALSPARIIMIPPSVRTQKTPALRIRKASAVCTATRLRGINSSPPKRKLEKPIQLTSAARSVSD